MTFPRDNHPGYEWFAYLATDGGVMYVPRRTASECAEYHEMVRRSMETKTGRKVKGGWTEGPNERVHEWGDTEFRVKPVFTVFQCSSNKNRWVYCVECRGRIPNGGKYRPTGGLHTCIPCAERLGI